jgi:hypothetical protein
MRRKSWLVGIGLIVAIATAVGGALLLLVNHEPGFYRRCAVPPGPVRVQHSQAFWAECLRVWAGIHNHDPNWYGTFTDAQINSYFAEEFLRSRMDRSLLPKGISAPRVAIEPDKVRLAFRYGEGLWSTIISLDLRVWLAKKELNVVVLELQGLHAGSLPISVETILESISEVCRRNNIDVKWYRHRRNPVALLHFQSDSPRPTVQLSKLELRQGLLVIGGTSDKPKIIAALLSRLTHLHQDTE